MLRKDSISRLVFHLGSLGVLLYTLLSGNTPFVCDRNDSHEAILARTSVKLQFTGPTWDRVTDNAKVCGYFRP